MSVKIAGLMTLKIDTHPHFSTFFLWLPSSHMLPAIVSMMVVY